MNLSEAGLKLIRAARRLMERDVRSALAEADHNMTVRRAQEAVELALKGALKAMGVDYPKVHDVGEVFVSHARATLPDAQEADLAQIEEISLSLAQARQPSSYFERDYGPEDGEQAAADAEHVLAWIEAFFPAPPVTKEEQRAQETESLSLTASTDSPSDRAAS